MQMSVCLNVFGLLMYIADDIVNLEEEIEIHDNEDDVLVLLNCRN